MNQGTLSYRGTRFPPDIIRHAVWLYRRFCLSFRDVEDIVAERGITVSYETIRQRCRVFGTEYARRLMRREVATETLSVWSWALPTAGVEHRVTPHGEESWQDPRPAP